MTDLELAAGVLLRSIVDACDINVGIDNELHNETPIRIANAWLEFLSGYKDDPKEILSKQFQVEENEMVVVRGIEFVSMCEHHLLPFVGLVSVGYIPNNKKVAGLSKIPRLVECFAKRLQLQERIGTEIANAIEAHLDVKGVAVNIVSKHSCASLRGVKQTNMEMVTSVLRGSFKKAEARNEFLSLIK